MTRNRSDESVYPVLLTDGVLIGCFRMRHNYGAVTLAVVVGFVLLGLEALYVARSELVRSFRSLSSSTGHSKEMYQDEGIVSEAMSYQTHNPLGQKISSGGRKFFILPIPELTSWLAGNFTKEATTYYNQALNEEQAEVWLFRSLIHHPDRTDDPEKADIVIIFAYLHLNWKLLSTVDDATKKSRLLPMEPEEWGRILLDRIIPGKIHTLATPTWNPVVANQIGIKHMSVLLQSHQVATMALGFERNYAWSWVATDKIVPIPYVVTLSVTREELRSSFDSDRVENFVFYAGDPRKHADDWSGCNRSRLVDKLMNRKDMDVKVLSGAERISQHDYNLRMLTSDFCLILCGDTPTSRSLASAVLSGCIPLIIGSRLRGLCDPPCHKGWGWNIANQSHIPYANLVDWDLPELNEEKFATDPMPELAKAFANQTQKHQIRMRLKTLHLAWVYGWGDPLTSNDFGHAADYAWKSLIKSAFG